MLVLLAGFLRFRVATQNFQFPFVVFFAVSPVHQCDRRGRCEQKPHDYEWENPLYGIALVFDLGGADCREKDTQAVANRVILRMVT